MNAPSLTDWVEASTDALIEIAPSVGFEGRRVPAADEVEASDCAALIPMFGSRGPVQIALVVGKPSCQALSKGLLCMEPTDDDLSMVDVADAIREIANMIAGMVKARLVDQDPKITLGLPVFVNGAVLPNSGQEFERVATMLGDNRADLVVFHEADPASLQGEVEEKPQEN